MVQKKIWSYWKAGRQKFQGEAKGGTTCCFWSLPTVKLHKANTHFKWTKTHGLFALFFPHPWLNFHRFMIYGFIWCQNFIFCCMFRNIDKRYGCFRKWWYPQNTPKWSFWVGKPMVVGYRHCRKPPYRYWTWFSVPPLRRFSRNKYEMLMIWQEMPSRGLRKPKQKTNKPGLLLREPWSGIASRDVSFKIYSIIIYNIYMGGTPKWMIYNGKPY